jgi:hypothetical protein
VAQRPGRVPCRSPQRRGRGRRRGSVSRAGRARALAHRRTSWTISPNPGARAGGDATAVPRDARPLLGSAAEDSKETRARCVKNASKMGHFWDMGGHEASVDADASPLTVSRWRKRRRCRGQPAACLRWRDGSRRLSSKMSAATVGYVSRAQTTGPCSASCRSSSWCARSSQPVWMPARPAPGRWPARAPALEQGGCSRSWGAVPRLQAHAAPAGSSGKGAVDRSPPRGLTRAPQHVVPRSADCLAQGTRSPGTPVVIGQPPLPPPSPPKRESFAQAVAALEGAGADHCSASHAMLRLRHGEHVPAPKRNSASQVSWRC